MSSPFSIIRRRAHPRAGLIGNPSDGYHGKTIAFTFSNYFAEAVLYESNAIELLPNRRDQTIYADFEEMERSIRDHGYYGGIRLMQAALKQFHNHCENRGIDLNGRGFSMRYFTNIPRHVGMAGSSAIITACLRCLMEYYGVEIENAELANLVLAAEKVELGIEAGLQDRVTQAFEGLVYMDFDRPTMESTGHGIYAPLPVSLLPSLYIAYRQSLGECSDVFHSDLRTRYNAGEAAVVAAMQAWADLTDQMRRALAEGDAARIAQLIDANFDLRRSLCRIHPDNIAMIDAARSAGASAKFTGSGGAIVGTYVDEAMFASLKEKLTQLGAVVFKPQISSEGTKE